MTGIGHQRRRVGDQAVAEFNDDEDRVQRGRDEEGLAGIPGCLMVVVMPTRVRVTLVSMACASSRSLVVGTVVFVIEALLRHQAGSGWGS